MTPEVRRFTRRALLVGTGAAAAYGVVRLTELDSSTPVGGPTTTPSPTYDGPGEAVDLTVRWRRLDPKASLPDLVAGWQFDETSGYAFTDMSGNDHSLYLIGEGWNTSESGLAGAVHRRGLRGGGAYLNGTRWLEADLATDLVPSAGLTLSCRVLLDTVPDGPVVLLGHGTNYTLALDTTGSIVLTIVDQAGVRRVVRSAPHAVAVGRWTQISVTADPATGALVLYLDGIAHAHVVVPAFAMRDDPARLVVGRLLPGALDEVAIHRVPLDAIAVRLLHIVGLPRLYTQTSESIDPARAVFTRFKGSDPVPHPVDSTTVLAHRFAASTTTDQGIRPLTVPTGLVFVPGAFGGGWEATTSRLEYPSPLSGGSGTFQAWYCTFADPADPHRLRRKEVFQATGAGSSLVLYTQGGSWRFDVRRPGGRLDMRAGPAQVLFPGTLEHVAVSWGALSGGGAGVTLYVNGVPAASLSIEPADTTYLHTVGLGGTAAAPSYCVLDDVAISDTVLAWGEVCPRGQASTGVAGLDLRDTFDRPVGASPMLWRAGSSDSAWSHRRMTWEQPQLVGDDPAAAMALFQATSAGVQAAYHPDAFGQASSIECGVAFPAAVDGWAGIFVQAPLVGGSFSGVTFMLNPSTGMLRLARYDGGRVAVSKVLPHDFPIAAETTYEMTLTCGSDGIARGFIDGTNVISMRVSTDWPTEGFSGMVTDGAQAFFSNLHFCALTPAGAASRVIRIRVLAHGVGAGVGVLDLLPFRWHKRPGELPWNYTTKDPEPAGNIAGAATAVPPRPIEAAAWRSEDSANPDLITVDGRVLFFMRGNPRINDLPAAARVGVLHRDVSSFDGVHFTDPNAPAGQVRGGTLLLSDVGVGAVSPLGPRQVQLNSPSTAYVGNGTLLFLGREYTVTVDGDPPPYDAVVFSRFDLATDTWEHPEPQLMNWGRAGSALLPDQADGGGEIHGSPEVVSLRDPDTDGYQAVVFQQTGPVGQSVMATAVLDNVSTGVPVLAPGLAVQTSLSRASGNAIYGFRVMFDNGIYYLHYNEGPHVPDWPDRFVLAAALDPYLGPWVANAATYADDSPYFRRGTPLEPDNGAIWQGTMFKLRGRYYLYYENYHSIGDVDVAYQYYNDPQAGSRVGYATG